MSIDETYHGWSEETLQTCLLSEPIPEEHFNNPLHAKLAGIWWADEGLDYEEDLPDRLEGAFDSLTPEQKLQLAAIIDDAAIEDPCGEHTIAVWHMPHELTVDADEVVRGIVGSLHDIKEAVLHTDGVAEWIFDGFVDSIYEAGAKWRGDDFQVSVGDENDRRYWLKYRQRELRARLAEMGQPALFEQK